MFAVSLAIVERSHWCNSCRNHCVCAQPMRDDLTLQRHLSLAGHIQKMISAHEAISWIWLHWENVYAPSQWQTTLHCNVVCHWLGAYINDPCSRGNMTALGKCNQPELITTVHHYLFTFNKTHYISKHGRIAKIICTLSYIAQPDSSMAY